MQKISLKLFSSNMSANPNVYDSLTELWEDINEGTRSFASRMLNRGKRRGAQVRRETEMKSLERGMEEVLKLNKDKPMEQQNVM